MSRYKIYRMDESTCRSTEGVTAPDGYHVKVQDLQNGRVNLYKISRMDESTCRSTEGVTAPDGHHVKVQDLQNRRANLELFHLIDNWSVIPDIDSPTKKKSVIP
ncbi:hypothetical protein RRG08_039476 [Elysia crispata]|uniref:Uncharacterized protein n=1 Tax=Elysia crispata TaxID=231223 RepID=A0AAE0YJM1_9GAST|nr:hypothetical protein RRG08_039476 [Elysia crispata]